MKQWAVVDGVLYGADAEVCTWVNERMGGGLVPTMAVAFGVLDEGGEEGLAPDNLPTRLIAGAYFFNHYDGDVSDITVSVAVDDIASARPAVFQRILAYPFGQLGVRRITAEIDQGNERAIRQAEMLGFKLEGLKRRMGKDGGDVGVFGLLPDEARFWKRPAQEAA